MTANGYFERRGRSIVVLALALLPLLGWAAIESLASNTNDVRDWFPARDAATYEYQWFEKYFGDDEFVLITWEGCTLDDPRLKSVGLGLSALRMAASNEPMFERVASGSSVLDSLREPPARL